MGCGSLTTSGVLFDIDGTLVTFNFDVQGSRRALFAELSQLGFDVSALNLTSPTQSVIDAAREQVTSGRVKADFGLVRKRLFSILDEFELESGKSVSAFPEARDVLASLRIKSVKLGVLTNSGRRAASRILDSSALSGFFDFVLTRDDVDAMKPRPEGVNRALALFALPKEKVVYVGDSPYDIMAAKAAGLKVISVATGNYTPERLRNEGADGVVGSLGELPGVLLL
jgi:HAD superfamily hydrolase (TIGR01549 family)